MSKTDCIHSSKFGAFQTVPKRAFGLVTVGLVFLMSAIASDGFSQTNPGKASSPLGVSGSSLAVEVGTTQIHLTWNEPAAMRWSDSSSADWKALGYLIVLEGAGPQEPDDNHKRAFLSPWKQNVYITKANTLTVDDLAPGESYKGMARQIGLLTYMPKVAGAHPKSDFMIRPLDSAKPIPLQVPEGFAAGSASPSKLGYEAVDLAELERSPSKYLGTIIDVSGYFVTNKAELGKSASTRNVCHARGVRQSPINDGRRTIFFVDGLRLPELKSGQLSMAPTNWIDIVGYFGRRRLMGRGDSEYEFDAISVRSVDKKAWPGPGVR
jgi:hypothetical protein